MTVFLMQENCRLNAVTTLLYSSSTIIAFNYKFYTWKIQTEYSENKSDVVYLYFERNVSLTYDKIVNY